MAQATFDIDHITLGDDRLAAAVAIMPVLHWGPGSIGGYEELLATTRQEIHLVAWTDDEPIGFALAHTWPGGESDPYLNALLGVAPAHRRKGVGSALFGSVSRDARELGKSGFHFEVLEDRADALEFLAHRGYSEVGRELQFELNLTAATPPPAEPPPGVEIVTRAQHPELVRGIFELACEAGRDIPGTEGEGDAVRYEDWYAFEIDRP
ncbi:MAG TPA: GNAT family N-acetyltransferase, partial [Actinomycetota bacterium]|nr:GNAT family N-acetyltransferase [Actinomycetota bacterium]